MRFGGGIPLDSHNRLMRCPSMTVSWATSSEPEIFGGTERFFFKKEKHCFKNNYKISLMLCMLKEKVPTQMEWRNNLALEADISTSH